MNKVITYEESDALEEEWRKAGIRHWWSSDEDGEIQFDTLEETVDYMYNNEGNDLENITEAYLYSGKLCSVDATYVWERATQGIEFGNDDLYIADLQNLLDTFFLKAGCHLVDKSYTVQLIPNQLIEDGLLP